MWVRKVMGGRVTVRTCLNLFWMRRSIWTWGRLGWVNVGGDELGQMQRWRYGLKKTKKLRFLHLIGCHSLSFCAYRPGEFEGDMLLISCHVVVTMPLRGRMAIVWGFAENRVTLIP